MDRDNSTLGSPYEADQLERDSHFLRGNEKMKYYPTKEVDPDGVGQHEPGAKLDKGKPEAAVLGMFGKALLAVAEVGTFGAKKYTWGGWETVSNGIRRYTSALLRHYFAERYQEYDTDLPVLHAAQVAWNALARLELMLREKEDEKS